MRLIQINKISTGSVIRYMALPGIVPRLRHLFQGGFVWLSMLLASIYQSVRLLPAGHPYLNPANKGKYSPLDVIREAAKYLTFKKQNIDQIIVFFLLLLGFVLFILQVAGFVVWLVISNAYAQVVAAGGGLFHTPNPCQDIAFRMLDMVFGVPNIYSINSALGCADPLDTSNFHSALHNLFHFYSIALLIVAVFVFLYYVVIMVAETASTGTPFGRRFANILAPIRLILAIGLLVPVSNGLNSAQYITLYAAKYGSGFATQAWIIFNNRPSSIWGVNIDPAASPSATDPADPASRSAASRLLAKPGRPDFSPVNEFLMLAHACKASYEYASSGSNRNDYDDSGNFLNADPLEVKAYFLFGNDRIEIDSMITIADTLTNLETSHPDYVGQDITIIFDENKDANIYPDQNEPLCGKLTIPAAAWFDDYYLLVGPMQIFNDLFNGEPRYRYYGIHAACRAGVIADQANGDAHPLCQTAYDNLKTAFGAPPVDFEITELPPGEWKSRNNADLLIREEDALEELFIEYATKVNAEHGIPNAALITGWAGAGMWYNQLSQWNGTLMDIVKASPQPTNMPYLMEKVEKERAAANSNTTAETRYSPFLDSDDGTQSMVFEEGTNDALRANMFHQIYKNLQLNESEKPIEEISVTNTFIDLFKSMLGIDGIIDMNAQRDVHPLAKLSVMGKSIIDHSIYNLLGALGLSGLGGALQIMGNNFAGPVNASVGFFNAFATLGITVGFILYFVLPFLPFIYFFFGLGSWVKSIFEAMVGVPLWALAHLRIDGNGLSGESASNGYFLILEIFLRPILIIFGMLASIIVFTALVSVLNSIFYLVTANLTGFDCVGCDATTQFMFFFEFNRSPIDEFFFTVVYTIFVYLIATSCFKLIDQIPDNILRWIGAGVPAFGDKDGDPTAGLVQYAAFGGATITGDAVGALQQGSRLGGQMGGMAANFFSGGPKPPNP